MVKIFIVILTLISPIKVNNKTVSRDATTWNTYKVCANMKEATNYYREQEKYNENFIYGEIVESEISLTTFKKIKEGIVENSTDNK